jgi:hypothetical protein
MRNQCRLLKLLTSYAVLTLFAGGCVGGSEYREIAAISDITQNIIAPGTDPVVCGYFSLSEKQVMRYMRQAREVVSHTYTQELDYAPCSVTGKLELKSGITATWRIELSGRGRVVFDDQEIKLLSCERCIPKQ